MNRVFNFAKRNIKEVLRDPLMYVFCLVFPIVMLVLFQVIGRYTNGSTPMFELRSLLPGIIMFSYTFVMLNIALLVSKDRQTSFLARLYSSPMKAHHFVLGYAVVGFIVGLAQTIVCIISGLIIASICNIGFISFGQALLLIVSQLPMLIISIFLGIIFGTLFNDRTAPGICSIFISIAGILGGCWMPLETMGEFATFCRFLPFYPSVYIGRVVTNATKLLGVKYSFDTTAILGIVPITVVMIVSTACAFLAIKKDMSRDR